MYVLSFLFLAGDVLVVSADKSKNLIFQRFVKHSRFTKIFKLLSGGPDIRFIFH